MSAFPLPPPDLGPARPGSLLRYARGDALFVILALTHGVLLLVWPSVWLVGLGLWWNANTISHNFIHRPFFRRPGANRAFSLLLSLVLGFPQELWRQRHLAHHAVGRARIRWQPGLGVELAAVLGLWGAMALLAPAFVALVYAPGFLLGQALCAVHGYHEHAGGTTSHYGRLYNLVFFNDGFHREHHAHPGAGWRRLPRCVEPGGRVSRWPAVLRWLESAPLDLLERLVLRAGGLQRFVVRKHESALRGLLAEIGDVSRVGIVGGGLYPRTALILRRLLPRAELTVIDGSAAHLDSARALVPDGVRLMHGWFDARRHGEYDLLVFPLALRGDRSVLYDTPPAATVLVHDWLWRRRGQGVIVSWLLLKRVNLVRGRRAPVAACVSAS